jgi:hypothetical protein
VQSEIQSAPSSPSTISLQHLLLTAVTVQFTAEDLSVCLYLHFYLYLHHYVMDISFLIFCDAMYCIVQCIHIRDFEAGISTQERFYKSS